MREIYALYCEREEFEGRVPPSYVEWLENELAEAWSDASEMFEALVVYQCNVSKILDISEDELKHRLMWIQ